MLVFAGKVRFNIILYRIYVIVSEPLVYQLRAYIYQARDLLAGDSNGLSGEYYSIYCADQPLQRWNSFA